jgi:methylglutaconyl-CoA hydratase
MTQLPVLFDVTDSGIATITLNKPEKHNAFDDDMIQHLTDIISSAIHNPEVRVIILNSEGSNFSAGADLGWMKRMANFSEEENLDDAMKLAKLMHTLYHSPKPTIASVQGKTFGGGIGLIACCHTAIMSGDAEFCFSEATLGIIPAVISPYIINAIGTRWARHYFLHAQRFNAQQALQIGLCHELVAPETLSHATHRAAENLLKNGPNALQAINYLVNDLSPSLINEDVMQFTARIIAKLRVSPEGQIGLNAFLNKTKANWNHS